MHNFLAVSNEGDVQKLLDQKSRIYYVLPADGDDGAPAAGDGGGVAGGAKQKPAAHRHPTVAKRTAEFKSEL